MTKLYRVVFSNGSQRLWRGTLPAILKAAEIVGKGQSFSVQEIAQ